MENFVTDAINLKSYNLSESDKIIVMYSKDKGLIKGVAKGVKKTKSKLGARMDMLVANKLMLHKGRNLDTICQAEALNTFKKIRENMDKIFYSMYVSEIVNNFGVEDDPCSSEIYDMLYLVLEKISEASSKIEILLPVIKFQLKMMQVSGFGIEFDNCLICGCSVSNENMYFSQKHGGIVCSDCHSEHHINTSMHYKLRDFLKSLSIVGLQNSSEFEKLANEKICLVSFNLLKTYIVSHSPKKFKTTDILQDVV